MTRFAQWTLDVHDLDTMATFWSRVLGYRIELGDEGDAHLRPPEGAPPQSLSMWLQPTTAKKQGKNRNHPDLVADDGDVDADVERLLALGATRADSARPVARGSSSSPTPRATSSASCGAEGSATACGRPTPLIVGVGNAWRA